MDDSAQEEDGAKTPEDLTALPEADALPPLDDGADGLLGHRLLDGAGRGEARVAKHGTGFYAAARRAALNVDGDDPLLRRQLPAQQPMSGTFLYAA